MQWATQVACLNDILYYGTFFQFLGHVESYKCVCASLFNALPVWQDIFDRCSRLKYSIFSICIVFKLSKRDRIYCCQHLLPTPKSQEDTTLKETSPQFVTSSIKNKRYPTWFCWWKDSFTMNSKQLPYILLYSIFKIILSKP